MTDYQLIVCPCEVELREKVSAKLLEGYSLCGNPAAFVRFDGQSMYMQAVCK